MSNKIEQKCGDDSTQYLAVDNGHIEVNYYNQSNEEKKDYGIIEEIFSFLSTKKIPDSYINTKSNSNRVTLGLRKVPLNFFGDNKNIIDDLITKTNKKRLLVEKFIKSRANEEDSISSLVIMLQYLFRDIKNVSNNNEIVEDEKIITEMAKRLIEDKYKNNPDYFFNSIAIVLYFFEMCDFGKK